MADLVLPILRKLFRVTERSVKAAKYKIDKRTKGAIEQKAERKE